PDNPESLPGNSVRSVYIDQQKNVWAGTNRGLALFNPQTEEFISFRHDAGNPHSLVADHIFNIREISNGDLWIATNMGGISILNLRSITLKNPESIQFRNIAATSDNLGLSSNYIHTLFQDSFGNIWIGNHSSGIDFIGKNPPPFQTLPYTLNKRGELKNKPVWGICADSEGQVWLGSENEIAVFKDSQQMRTVNISNYLSNPYTRIYAIRQDRHGVLWFGMSDEGVLKFNPRTGKFERIRLDINNLDFITFFEETDGKMWTGTVNGVYSFENGKMQKEDSINNQLSDIMIRSILRDRHGKLWVGTFGKGISIFDKNNRLTTRLETDNGFCSNAVSHLYLDSQGGIWAGTRNGLAYFHDADKPEKYELYNEKQGLADTYIRAIQEDKNGNIWISSNGSISLWNRQKQLFDNYDHRDGIPMGNFIEGSACMTADGTVYFGSITGVCRFNPAGLTAEYQVAPIQIMECRVFDRQIESREYGFPIPVENGRIELPHNQNSFRMSFSSPDYAQSGQVEYAYMIEGLDNKWYNIQGENQVTFRSLSSGEYTFRVKARLRNHEWDESHIASIFVKIHPPFWLAWYAELFYAILLCIGIFAVVRFYRHRFHLKSSLEIERKESQNRQALNDERLRFYTNITHELRTPLTLILGPLEDLLNDKNLSDFYNKKIEIIHGSATRLLNLINQILEFRKTETQNRKLTVSKGNPANLVTEIGLRYKEMNRNDKVKYCINIETKDTYLYFDPDMLTTILNNLLSNAVKYTPEGEIKLSLRQVEDKENIYMEIEVSDTGYGIEDKALPHIFDRYYQAKGNYQASGTGIGLALVKSLTDLHEGTIRVESTVGKGTIFTFRILKDNTYPDALHKEKENTRIVETLRTAYLQEEEESNTLPIVLVIEDNADIREYIASSFTDGYTVITADDGKEGLELAQKYIPNIIVSDIMMPVMDGIELCRAVKDDVRTSHIPIILLTAKDTTQDKEEGYESGADSYLTKPFSAKLLHSRINNLLESRRKLAQQITQRIAANIPITENTKPAPEMDMSALDKDFLVKITDLIET
ncbi:MAG: response regulator, partial [Dysgonamonadaceae bacterium]|nr:response regulator [Dysgonamonadaceae bacterium]